LEFNSHVHALVFAKHLQDPSQSREARIFFRKDLIMQSWKKLVITLLRAALRAGCLVSALTNRELEHLLTREEGRWWSIHIQRFKGKEHFLRYAGRYARRPPIAEGRIQEVSNGLLSFWYKDKRLKQRQTVVCTVTEFIDRWAQHIPKRYRHAVRYCGIFAPRRWNRVAETAFLLSGQRRRPKPKRLPWNLSVHHLWGRDPLTDGSGCRMRFVKHLSPVAAWTFPVALKGNRAQSNRVEECWCAQAVPPTEVNSLLESNKLAPEEILTPRVLFRQQAGRKYAHLPRTDAPIEVRTILNLCFWFSYWFNRARTAILGRLSLWKTYQLICEWFDHSPLVASEVHLLTPVSRARAPVNARIISPQSERAS